MKKILSVALVVVMLFAVVALAGCGKEEATLKFGLGVVASYGEAKETTGEFNTTAVAVLLDAEGKIVKIDLDTAQIKPSWTEDGKKVDVEDLRTKYEKATTTVWLRLLLTRMATVLALNGTSSPLLTLSLL